MLGLALVAGVLTCIFAFSWAARLEIALARIESRHEIDFKIQHERLEAAEKVAGRTQKAMDALAGARAINDEAINDRIDELASRFDSHRTALRAHEKLPKVRRR